MKEQCKVCEKEATVEYPKDHFYCKSCYTLFKYTRKHYLSHPNAKGYEDKK